MEAWLWLLKLARGQRAEPWQLIPRARVLVMRRKSGMGKGSKGCIARYRD